jgi:hypothetical protein
VLQALEFPIYGSSWLGQDYVLIFKLSSSSKSIMFENRVLSRIFGPRGDEVTGEWRKLHNERLHYLYSSPNIVRVIKSRRMRWARLVAGMGRGEACTGFWSGNLRARDCWGDPSVDGRIILRRIFKWDVGYGLD